MELKLHLTKDNAIYFWAACKNEMEIDKLRGFGIDITDKADLNLLYSNGLIENEFDLDYDFLDFTKSGHAYDAERTINRLIEAIRSDRLSDMTDLRENYPHLFNKKISP